MKASLVFLALFLSCALLAQEEEPPVVEHVSIRTHHVAYHDYWRTEFSPGLVAVVEALLDRWGPVALWEYEVEPGYDYTLVVRSADRSPPRRIALAPVTVASTRFYWAAPIFGDRVFRLERVKSAFVPD